MIKQYRWIFWCAKCNAQCDFISITEYDRAMFARHAGFKYDRKRRGWLCERCAK
jgi:hypothetical protein